MDSVGENVSQEEPWEWLDRMLQAVGEHVVLKKHSPPKKGIHSHTRKNMGPPNACEINTYVLDFGGGSGIPIHFSMFLASLRTKYGGAPCIVSTLGSSRISTAVWFPCSIAMDSWNWFVIFPLTDDSSWSKYSFWWFSIPYHFNISHD